MKKRLFTALLALILLLTALPQGALGQSPSPTPRVIVLGPTQAPPRPAPSSEPVRDPEQAALFQAVVEEWLVPLWQQDPGSYLLTPGERVGIVNHLTESGLNMTQDWRNALWGSGAAESRGDYLYQLALWQWGQRWTVEQQYWYGQICVACGIWEDNPYLLPMAGELTHKEAQRRAAEAVAAQFGVTAQWLDRCSVTCEFSLCQEPDMAGLRVWRFDFYPVGDPWRGYYRVWVEGGGVQVRAEKVG